MGVNPVEKVHPYHHQTENVKHIEHEFWPSLSQPEMEHTIEHNTYRQHTGDSSYNDIENLGIAFKSCLHIYRI